MLGLSLLLVGEKELAAGSRVAAGVHAFTGKFAELS